MNRYLFIGVLSTLLMTGLAYGQTCPTVEYPEQIVVNEKLAWTDTFAIQGVNPLLEGSMNLGRVQGPFLNFGRHYILQDASNQPIASAKRKWFSVGTAVNIYDCNGQKIGAFHENILKELKSLRTHYTIEDAAGQVIAESANVNFLTTRFELRDPQGELFAVIERSVQGFFTDSWTVSRTQHPAADSRVLIMMAVYKTITDRESLSAALQNLAKSGSKQ